MSNLTIKNDSVQSLYVNYCKNAFLVNRKYQRKLVWTLEEKKNFINSIASEYPVPLVLLARVERNDAEYYEIIDGMQRFEAIFSFLDNAYPVQINGIEGYFDLETLAKTKELLDKGVLSQGKPILPRDICIKIVEYQLPISISTFKESKDIEEIFRRINATGRRLSSQDLRQAGAISNFSDIVRKISTHIRRDSSPGDIVPLSKMREISLSSSGLNYGIDIRKTFWVKNKIITVSNMRLSRDEELISHILMYMLLGENVAPTAKNLNKIYGLDSDDEQIVSKTVRAIEKYGQENIIKNFLKVFDELDQLIYLSGKKFNEIVFTDEYGGGIGKIFQVVFLTIFKFMEEGKIIENRIKLIDIMNDIGSDEFKNIGEGWTAKYRAKKIKALKGMMEQFFIKTDKYDPMQDNWISKLENLLMQSKIEQQLYDFKLGIHSLSDGKLNRNCLSKIVRTLTAMGNTFKGAKGYVIVGIADTVADVDMFKKVYGSEAITFNTFAITGVNDEIKKYYKNRDEYFNKIKQFIEEEPVNEFVKSYITRHMRLIQYHNKDILVFVLKSEDKPLIYNEACYERRAANNAKIYENEKVGIENMIELTRRFS